MRGDGLSPSERRLGVGKWGGALAAIQKAAEVELRTEALLFGSGCAHRTDVLLRHAAILSPVILHPSKEYRPLFLPGSNTSAWKPCFYSICSRALWTGYQSCDKATTRRISLPSYFRHRRPGYPPASPWAHGTQWRGCRLSSEMAAVS